MAEEKRMASRYANDIEIAHAQRDFQLKKAAYDMEVEAKKAQSNLAADLQVSTHRFFKILHNACVVLPFVESH